MTEITVGLAGGGLYTWRPSGGEVWSYSNTHGDLVLTANSAGTQTGVVGSYDPFGNPLGSTAIDNSAGNLEYGWHGQAQRPLEHETGITPTIEMGARPYQAALGRFLAVDPIEGGTPNDYLYVEDPVNLQDLDGHGGNPGSGFAGNMSRGCERASRNATRRRSAACHRSRDRGVRSGISAHGRCRLGNGWGALSVVAAGVGILVCPFTAGGGCAMAAAAVSAGAGIAGSAESNLGGACRNTGRFARDVAINLGSFGLGIAAGRLATVPGIAAQDARALGDTASGLSDTATQAAGYGISRRDKRC